MQGLGRLRRESFFSRGSGQRTLNQSRSYRILERSFSRKRSLEMKKASFVVLLSQERFIERGQALHQVSLSAPGA